MSESREMRCEATVMIRVDGTAPVDWISRVAAPDFPYKHYDLTPMSEAEGIKMLCDNALRNGIDDASRLDGWADLRRGMVRLQVSDVELLDVPVA